MANLLMYLTIVIAQNHCVALKATQASKYNECIYNTVYCLGNSVTDKSMKCVTVEVTSPPTKKK